MPAMLKDYHETKGLSVSLEVTVTSKAGKMELIDHMPVTRRDGKLIVGEGVKFERIRRTVPGPPCRHGGSVQQRQTSGSERPREARKDELSETAHTGRRRMISGLTSTSKKKETP